MKELYTNIRTNLHRSRVVRLVRHGTNLKYNNWKKITSENDGGLTISILREFKIS